jgi:CRP-like cAMP-binding protein
MKGLESLLAEHPFFAGLADEYVALIAGCGSNVAFEPGEYIFREGDPADLFYIVRHGRVQLEIFVPHRGPLAIETVGEGEVLGWSWLVPPYQWSLDARATETTRAVALDGACLRGKCDQDHELGYELMKRFAPIIAERLQTTRLRLLDVYGREPV